MSCGIQLHSRETLAKRAAAEGGTSQLMNVVRHLAWVGIMVGSES